MSRIEFGASSSVASGDGLPFEAFVVLRETLVVAHRSQQNITFSQPSSFTRLDAAALQFGPRETVYVVQQPDGKFWVDRKQPEAENRGNRKFAAAAPAATVTATFAAARLPPGIGSGFVAITNDATVRAFLQSTPIHVDNVSLIGFHHDRSSGTKIINVLSEAEFDACFVKPVAFLVGKVSWRIDGNTFVLVEHADSVFVMDRKGLIHITPENNMKSAAQFTPLNSPIEDHKTIIYFK